jgi:hypothetical protein
MTFFPIVRRWLVPPNLLHVCLSEMALDGAQGNEGICLWLGIRQEDETATVTHAVKLRGEGITKSAANIRLTPELMREVHAYAKSVGKQLVGQIHSHGKEFGVDLSFVDIRYGVSVPYYLSIVAPSYGLDSATSWDDCGIHVYHPDEGFIRVRSDQIAETISVVDLMTLEEHTVYGSAIQ